MSMDLVTCRTCGAEGFQPCVSRRGYGEPMIRRHSERVSAQRLLDEAAAFNESYPVGAPVMFWPGLRTVEGRVSKTRTPAWAMSQDAVVSVEG